MRGDSDPPGVTGRGAAFFVSFQKFRARGGADAGLGRLRYNRPAYGELGSSHHARSCLVPERAAADRGAGRFVGHQPALRGALGPAGHAAGGRGGRGIDSGHRPGPRGGPLAADLERVHRLRRRDADRACVLQDAARADERPLRRSGFAHVGGAGPAHLVVPLRAAAGAAADERDRRSERVRVGAAHRRQGGDCAAEGVRVRGRSGRRVEGVAGSAVCVCRLGG